MIDTYGIIESDLRIAHRLIGKTLQPEICRQL